MVCSVVRFGAHVKHITRGQRKFQETSISGTARRAPGRSGPYRYAPYRYAPSRIALYQCPTCSAVLSVSQRMYNTQRVAKGSSKKHPFPGRPAVPQTRCVPYPLCPVPQCSVSHSGVEHSGTGHSGPRAWRYFPAVRAHVTRVGRLDALTKDLFW